MHIKLDISVWNLKTIINVLLRIPGFSGRSKRVLTHCLLIAPIQISMSNVNHEWSRHCSLGYLPLPFHYLINSCCAEYPGNQIGIVDKQ